MPIGFGDPAEIEAARATLAQRNDVRLSDTAADMSPPEQIKAVLSVF